MANTFIPFDNNPINTEIRNNASYTVPSGKYARITILSYDSSDSSMAYDLTTGGASSATISEFELINNAPSTSSISFVTAYTVPDGCYFEGQVTCAHSGAIASEARYRVGTNGREFFGMSSAIANAAYISDCMYVKLGPGGVIQHRIVTTGTTTTHIVGVLHKNKIGGNEFWLRSGDQITFPGVILINEYNVIS